jgi:hypothetical protein
MLKIHHCCYLFNVIQPSTTVQTVHVLMEVIAQTHSQATPARVRLASPTATVDQVAAGNMQ